MQVGCGACQQEPSCVTAKGAQRFQASQQQPSHARRLLVYSTPAAVGRPLPPSLASQAHLMWQRVFLAAAGFPAAKAVRLTC